MLPSATRDGEATLRRIVTVLLVVYLLVTVTRFAWTADDAFITLRTVDNFVHGRGLRWNVMERVQSYTAPLWLFLLALPYAVTREPFFTTIAVSIATTLAAFVLLTRLCRSTWTLLVAATLLLLSPAYVDFSTSGLENPLTHLLLALFAGELYVAPGQRRPGRALVWATLCLLNRLDTVTLLLPGMALVVWQDARPWPARLRTLALALAPLLAWELFSIVYYGFPFPNTAYAKLSSGLPSLQLAKQGLAYLSSHVRKDPFTLLAIAALALWGALSRQRAQQALAAGIALNLVYLVRIGGDFMFGRMLTPSLFTAALLATRLPLPAWPAKKPLALWALLLLVGLLAPRAPVGKVISRPPPPFDEHGISDERLFFGAKASLLSAGRGVELPSYDLARAGREIRRRGQSVLLAGGFVGYIGFFGGPKLHLVDTMALCDPLLARLPMAPDPHWRIGHFERRLPDGYIDSLRSGQNRIVDPAVAGLFDDLVLVTRGPIFSGRRVLAMLRIWLDVD